VFGLAGSVVLALSAGSRRIRRDRYEPIPIGAGRPVLHEGASERFGSELRALRSIEVSPELVSDIETELQWGLIWHDFERTMQAEIDRVFAPYAALAECDDFDDLRDLLGLPELAAA